MSTLGYLRVSTDMQSVESQKLGIVNYSNDHNICIDKWVEETVSGAVDPKRRKLGGVLPNLRRGDTLIVSEVSRLGRTIRMLVNVIDGLLNRGIKIVLVKQNMVLDPSSTDAFKSMQTTVFITVFALCAQIERELIKARIKEGVERAIANGADWSTHARGPHKTRAKSLAEEMVKLYRDGKTKKQIARRFNLSLATVYRHLHFQGAM